MDKNKALTIIKNVIDASLKAGLFQNMETVVEVTSAFNFVINLQDTLKTSKPVEIEEKANS